MPRGVSRGLFGRQVAVRLYCVTAQSLHRVPTAWRIGDPNGACPIFDATGAKLSPGRCNTGATPMPYACEHASAAMLEKLAQGSGCLPKNQHCVEITIPDDISYEVLDPAHLPGWADPACVASKAFGGTWQTARRSLLLIVPSVVARMQHNFLLNKLGETLWPPVETFVQRDWRQPVPALSHRPIRRELPLMQRLDTRT